MAHIGKKGGLGGVGGFRLEALSERIVTGLLHFHRQILHMEAQARILLHPAHQRTPRPPHLQTEQRRGNSDHIIEGRIPDREAQGGQGGDRHDGADEHCHVAAPRQHQRGDHRNSTGGKEQMIDGIAVIPKQPRHRAPGRADAKLHRAKSPVPRPEITTGVAPDLALIEGGDGGGGCHRRQQDHGKIEGLAERAFTQNAEQIGAEKSQRQSPERRRRPSGLHRSRGQVELGAQHAGIFAPGFLNGRNAQHFVSPSRQFRQPEV